MAVTIVWFPQRGRGHLGMASDGARYRITSEPYGSIRRFRLYHVTPTGRVDISTERYLRMRRACADAVRHANGERAER